MNPRVFVLSTSLMGLLPIGCEKVPTFQEMTGQQPQNAAQPATNAPNTTPSSSPTTPAPVVNVPKATVPPAVVIAEIMKRPPHGIGDEHIVTLTNLPSGLEEIKTFNITRSAATDEGVRLIGKLPALYELNLTATNIGGSGLAGLKDLASLKVLTLNEIQTLTPNCWDLVSELTQLEKLNLVATRIADNDVMKLVKLTNLKELNLSSTAVTDAVFAHLADMENLEVLRFEMNSLIDGSGLQAFAKSKNKSPLRELHAFRTKINLAGLKHVKGIPNLELLNISDTLLNDQQLSELKGTSNIKTLIVSYNRLTTAGMTIFSTMKKLQELDLQNMDSINDPCLGVLSKMRGLQTLNVTRTSCTRRGLQEFAKIHKNCKLIYSDDLPQ